MSSEAASVPATATPPGSAPKLVKKRAQNACDACRQRKVKCVVEENGTVCNSCVALKISCRHEKERKRRGPPSKYVEAQRQRDLVEGSSMIPLSPLGQSFASPGYAPPPPSYHGLDQLAPGFIIQQIVHDWFELVHPVAPLLHRDSFMQQLADPLASQSPDFIDLVVSVSAATISALRRRASAYGGLITVEKCYQTYLASERANGPGRLDFTRCLIKYNFCTALSTERGMDDQAPQLLLAEASAGVMHILHYDLHSLPFITHELVKRLSWLCYAGECTFGLHGRPFLSIDLSEELFEASKPLVLTDAELGRMTPGEEQWHGNKTSYIPGLIELIKLFMLWQKSQKGDRYDLGYLRRYIALALSSPDNFPPELRWRGGLSRPARSNFGTDVQTVNLYIAQIQIRSFLLDQMDRAARQINDSDTVSEVMSSRQTLVDDMLAILYQMPEDTLEANGYSLINKLRDIGLGILNNNGSERAFTNLDRLLAKLERLDVRPGSQLDAQTSPAASLARLSSIT